MNAQEEEQELDGAVASSSQCNDDSKQTKQSESKAEINNEDEENIIDENLEHLNKFLSNLYERGLDNIPVKSLGKINDLRKKWKEILCLTEDSEDSRSSKQSVGSEDELGKIGIANQIKKYKEEKGNKTKRKVKDEYQARLDNDSDSSSGSGSSDQTSESKESDASIKKSKLNGHKEKKAKLKVHKKKKSSRSYHSQSKEFNQMLARLDNRKLPQQEKLDENSGEDFRLYLEKFESYCKQNFKGDTIF